ncbi:MAG: FAD/NAD(P)-binding protein [Phycisphaerales bacterium]|jgi:uncharacterized NAD(P)/FAD-binding protein YdhS
MSDQHPPQSVCIIGGGFCGTAVAAGLVRAGFAGEITLIESKPVAGPGIAYAPPSERLLLNVPARGMGMWAPDPGDFVAWLTASGRQVDPGSFVPRAWYGEYLQARLGEAIGAAGGRLRVVRAAANDASRLADGSWRVDGAGGETVRADALVLAPGNFRPGPPAGLEGLTAPWWHPDPWVPEAHAKCRDGERVLIIGSGLTMVDLCISLTSRGERPRITVLSRHGLLPCVHATPGAEKIAAMPPEPGTNLHQIFIHVRREARRIMRAGGDWRAAVDCLRPITPALWAGLSTRDHARFMSRLRVYWDVHRHRVPAEVVARIVELKQRNLIRIEAGMVRSAKDFGASGEITWRERGTGSLERGTFDRVINCTGARTAIVASPLLNAMAARGEIRSEELGLGLLTDGFGRVVNAAGAPHANLWALGALRRGTLWESSAVPELRVQAGAVVSQIAGG